MEDLAGFADAFMFDGDDGESATQKEGFVNLHYISVSYDNLEYKAETSMPIKDDDSKYNFGFGNKMEISTIGYGSCKKLKWE